MAHTPAYLNWKNSRQFGLFKLTLSSTLSKQRFQFLPSPHKLYKTLSHEIYSHVHLIFVTSSCKMFTHFKPIRQLRTKHLFLSETLTTYQCNIFNFLLRTFTKNSKLKKQTKNIPKKNAFQMLLLFFLLTVFLSWKGTPVLFFEIAFFLNPIPLLFSSKACFLGFVTVPTSFFANYIIWGVPHQTINSLFSHFQRSSLAFQVGAKPSHFTYINFTILSEESRVVLSYSPSSPLRKKDWKISEIIFERSWILNEELFAQPSTSAERVRATTH